MRGPILKTKTKLSKKLSVLMECAHNGVAQVAEREEEAGQLSHSTQSADAIFSHVTNMLGNII